MDMYLNPRAVRRICHYADESIAAHSVKPLVAAFTAEQLEVMAHALPGGDVEALLASVLRSWDGSSHADLLLALEQHLEAVELRLKYLRWSEQPSPDSLMPRSGRRPLPRHASAHQLLSALKRRA